MQRSMSCKSPLHVIIRRRTKRPTNVVFWRTIRRTCTEKNSEEWETYAIFSAMKQCWTTWRTSYKINNGLIHSTHISAWNRKRNARRETYGALWMRNVQVSEVGWKNGEQKDVLTSKGNTYDELGRVLQDINGCITTQLHQRPTPLHSILILTCYRYRIQN